MKKNLKFDNVKTAAKYLANRGISLKEVNHYNSDNSVTSECTNLFELISYSSSKVIGLAMAKIKKDEKHILLQSVEIEFND